MVLQISTHLQSVWLHEASAFRKTILEHCPCLNEWVMPFWFTGQLPTWLQGMLLRNGPGMHTIGDSKYNHWFDGLALLHSFTFKNGKLLHAGLKGTQRPTLWCLTLLILFQVGLECCGFCLQNAVWGGNCCGGSLSTHSLAPHPSQQQLECLCRAVCREMLLVLPSAVLKFRAVVTPAQHKPSSGQVPAGQPSPSTQVKKISVFSCESATGTVVPRGSSAVDEQLSFREDQHSPFGIWLQL